MARFVCKIGTPTGSMRAQEVEEASAEAARRSLEAQGYYVFDVQVRREALGGPRRSRAGLNRIGAKALLVFNQELLALVKAGLPILTALDLLGERSQQPRLRTLLADVREAVKGGAALSAALAHHPHVFSPLYTAALHAGEQSGTLVDALTRYVEYQKRILALRQRFRAALTYPGVLCLASGAVILFLLTFVVPTFTRIYGDLEAELPVATRLLVALTGRLREVLPLVGGGAALLLMAAWRWRATPAGHQTMDRWILGLPWVGDLARGYLFSRFARTLAMTLGGGIPMIPSLQITLGTVGNAYLTGALRPAIPRVAAGSSLADALGSSGVVPPLVLEMVAVGESSGSLGDMLGHVADLHDAEVDTRLTALAAVIEPVIMIGMGLVVATIVVIMYLPIFHLSAAVR
ncbi:MAG: type II secretion system F family protein [candidate division NC10 bacterium]|nr:type II secretion system F family protein [candidate division NC10 bacterium]